MPLKQIANHKKTGQRKIMKKKIYNSHSKPYKSKVLYIYLGTNPQLPSLCSYFNAFQHFLSLLPSFLPYSQGNCLFFGVIHSESFMLNLKKNDILIFLYKLKVQKKTVAYCAAAGENDLIEWQIANRLDTITAEIVLSVWDIDTNITKSHDEEC